MNAPSALTFTSCVSGLTPGVESVNVTQEGARGQTKTRYRKGRPGCLTAFVLSLAKIEDIFLKIIRIAERGSYWVWSQAVM